MTKQDLPGWQNCWVRYSAPVQRHMAITALIKEETIKDCKAAVFVQQHAHIDCTCTCCTAKSAEQCIRSSMLACNKACHPLTRGQLPHCPWIGCPLVCTCQVQRHEVSIFKVSCAFCMQSLRAAMWALPTAMLTGLMQLRIHIGMQAYLKHRSCRAGCCCPAVGPVFLGTAGSLCCD